jgi:hypothetical protein
MSFYESFRDELLKIARRFMESPEEYSERLRGSSSHPGLEEFRKRRRVGVMETGKGPVLVRGKTPEQISKAKVKAAVPRLKMAAAEEPKAPEAEEDADKAKKRAKYASIMKRVMLAKQRAPAVV